MKLVREHINEKFKEDSDPITDMGIGGYTFETLKPGAIFKAKRLGIAVTMYSGHFTAYYKGVQIRPDIFCIVVSIGDFSPGYKDIYFARCQKEDIEVVMNRMRNGVHIQKRRMIVSKRMFDNRFEIIDRGF